MYIVYATKNIIFIKSALTKAYSGIQVNQNLQSNLFMRR